MKVLIFGPKDDGSYVIEFKTAEGEAPRSEAHVIRHSGPAGDVFPGRGPRLLEAEGLEVTLDQGNDINALIELAAKKPVAG